MAVTFDAVGPTQTGNGHPYGPAATNPATWTHTCAAGATELLIGIAVDIGSGDGALTATATYNSLACSSVVRWESGGGTNTAGFVQVFRLHNPPTGSAFTVSVSVTGGTPDEISGGSISFLGSSTISAAVHADSASTSVTSGTIAIPTTSASNMVVGFVGNGSGYTGAWPADFTAGTGRWAAPGTGGPAGACSYAGCATAAGAASGNVSISWTQNSDFFAAVGIEVQAAVAGTPPLHSPVRARIPQVRARGVFMGSAPRDTSYGTGQVQWNAGAPVRNPSPGPVFRQRTFQKRPRAAMSLPAPRGRCITGSPGAPVQNPPPPVTGAPFYPQQQAVRARLPQPPAGMGAMRGRCASSPPQPVRNPSPGPVFRLKPAPVRYVLPPWQPRAGRIGSSFGGPVVNPHRGPPVYAPLGPSRARLPLPPRGRVASSPGGPVSNPAPSGTGPVFFPFRFPVRVRPALPPRGRMAALWGAPVQNPAAGPVFIQAASPVKARAPLPRRGRVYSTAKPAAVIVPPPSGPSFRPAVQAIRARLPQQPVLRGRVASSPGGPVRNPSPGPVFRQLPRPVQATNPLPKRGWITAHPGGPVQNPGPVSVGPVFYPRNTAKAQQPLPRRGICRAIRFGPLPANPTQGPVFTQAVSPARARTPLPPRGRIASNPGGPVQNPPPIVQGPPFFPFRSPVRVHPSLPPRGRTAGNPGIPVPPPVTPAPVYPLRGPVQARFPLPPRGRIASNPGGPVQNPVSHSGPPFFPLHWPARIRPSLPARGRVSANPGAAVRNPHPGPVFAQAVRPIRAVIPQNAPRGRTGSNPGGPVANIPFVRLLLATGQPFFLWQPQESFTLWDTASPAAAWQTGVPYTSE